MAGSACSSEASRPWGFTLVEVLAAMVLTLASLALAVSAGQALVRFAQEAHAEQAGLAAGQAKMEEILSLLPAYREEGHDVVEAGGVRVTRTWRVRPSGEFPGLDRVEVNARWDEPGLRVLVLVAVAP